MSKKQPVIEVKSADTFVIPDKPIANSEPYREHVGSHDNKHPVDDGVVPVIKTTKQLPEKVKICIYRFPFGGQEHPTCTNWLMNALFTLHVHPRVAAVVTEHINATPITMCRNRAIRHAIDNDVDFAIMVDSDMWPDYEQGGPDKDKNVLPFLPHALDFALAHDGPCVVAAPYCSQPPEENVLVMRWRHQEGNDPDGQVKLAKFTREEAIGRTGFEEVAALGTGLILIDMRPLVELPGPWFTYQYSDHEQVKMTASEDVVFTRDLSFAGIPQYVFWDAWAGHWKMKMVGKPTGLPYNCVPARFASAMRVTMAREQEAKAKAKEAAQHGTRDPS